MTTLPRRENDLKRRRIRGYEILIYMKRNVRLIAFILGNLFVSSGLVAETVAEKPLHKCAGQLKQAEQPVTNFTQGEVPVLVLKQMRNTGGALQKSIGGRTLNDNLTTGLSELLKERSKDRWIVAKGRTPNHSPNARLFSLEEDISHTETDEEDGGPYLLSVRLYEEIGKRHRLVAQWTGYADTFRYLTSNLRGDRRVSREGLLGLLVDRLKDSLLYDHSLKTEKQTRLK